MHALNICHLTITSDTLSMAPYTIFLDSVRWFFFLKRSVGHNVPTRNGYISLQLKEHLIKAAPFNLIFSRS